MTDIQILRNANAISSTLSREFFPMNAERQILVRSSFSPSPLIMGSGCARKNNITIFSDQEEMLGSCSTGRFLQSQNTFLLIEDKKKP